MLLASAVRFELGPALVREDPLAPVDAVVVSIGGWYGAVLEAVRLQTTGVAPRVVVARWASQSNAADDGIRRLGIPLLTPPELVTATLNRGGVPATAVDRVDVDVDGTGADIAALAARVRERGYRRVVLLTARSHSRRAGWLLGRALPADVTILVRSPPDDPFDPAAWWRSRESTREVLMESLRWANAVVLRDPWRD